MLTVQLLIVFSRVSLSYIHTNYTHTSIHLSTRGLYAMEICGFMYNGKPTFSENARHVMNIISHPSDNYAPRLDAITGDRVAIEMLILHFTQSDALETLAHFNKPQGVSAHYTVTDTCEIWQHVIESNAAHHAGLSHWRGHDNVNNRAIGIEIVHPGYKWHDRLSVDDTVVIPGMREEWVPYQMKQIETLVPLIHQIIARHNIKPHNIIGHSDIAPDRKIDPGPLFPWEWLATEHGIGLWPCFDTPPHTCDLSENHVRDLLVNIGYDINGDMMRRHIERRIRAFQMHWRPTRIDGVIDVETVWRMQKVADTIAK